MTAERPSRQHLTGYRLRDYDDGAAVIRMEDPRHFGHILRFARELAGLTHEELARLTGFGEAEIGLFESGWRRPNLATASRIAGALGYDLALIPREDTP